MPRKNYDHTAILNSQAREEVSIDSQSPADIIAALEEEVGPGVDIAHLLSATKRNNSVEK